MLDNKLPTGADTVTPEKAKPAAHQKKHTTGRSTTDQILSAIRSFAIHAGIALALLFAIQACTANWNPIDCNTKGVACAF